jgi:hypothetical protein
MCIMSDEKYLFKRNGNWQFHKRLPPGARTEYHRVSLKTKSIKEAQKKRDIILSKWPRIIAEMFEAKAVMDLRKRYLNAFNPAEAAHLADLIQTEAEDMAYEKGVFDLIQTTDYDNLTAEEREPLDFYRTATGQLSPLPVVVPPWLEQISNKGTRADYKTGLKNLMQHFAAAEEITHQRAAAFLEAAPAHYDISKATVGKWQSGYINLWKYLKKDYSVWKNHTIPNTPEKNKDRDIWENSEVRRLIESARGSNRKPWLAHAILIAAHTGAREAAIAQCKYYPEKQVVWFPKAKYETRDRQIPVHPAIVDSLIFWMENRKAQRTISRGFTELKISLGYSQAKVFHSFRNTFIQHLQFNNVPEALVAALVGHKIRTVTFGIYGQGQQLVSTLQEAIHLIDYDKDDWVRMYT